MKKIICAVLLQFCAVSYASAEIINASINYLQPTADGALRISFDFQNTTDRAICIDDRIFNDSLSLLYPGLEIISSDRGLLEQPNFGVLIPEMPVRHIKILPGKVIYTSYLLGADWIFSGIIRSSGDSYKIRIKIPAIPCLIGEADLSQELTLEEFTIITQADETQRLLLSIQSGWSEGFLFSSDGIIPLDR